MPLPRVARAVRAISGMGGAEFSLLELVTHLRGVYEFHLIVPGEGPLKESAELAGAKVWVLPWPEAIAGTGETAGPGGEDAARCDWIAIVFVAAVELAR
jgi:hypothetical protein